MGHIYQCCITVLRRVKRNLYTHNYPITYAVEKNKFKMYNCLVNHDASHWVSAHHWNIVCVTLLFQCPSLKDKCVTLLFQCPSLKDICVTLFHNYYYLCNSIISLLLIILFNTEWNQLNISRDGRLVIRTKMTQQKSV